MKLLAAIPLVFLLVACTAAHPIVYSDPSFKPATVRSLQLVLDERSSLGEMAKQPALMRHTIDAVTNALRAKGYEIVADRPTHLLWVEIEQEQSSKRYIPHPITVRRLPVVCEIRTADTHQQLKRASIDGYRPNAARTAANWIKDPSKLYPIAIQDACEQALMGIPPVH